MRNWLVFLLVQWLIWPLHAVPTQYKTPGRSVAKCAKPIVRKEWRSLSLKERQSYISAVKCLFKKKPQTSTEILPGVTNRFEDFLGDHLLQTNQNHFTGFFHPWHRLLIQRYEVELRNCGYGGAQPYWDWTIDAVSRDAMFNSEIFDPDTGFGGNGKWVPGTLEDPAPGVEVTATGITFNLTDRTGGGCIPDGPFKNLTIHMGPGYNASYHPWCVRRDFVPNEFIHWGSQECVNESMVTGSFNKFSQQSESTIHLAGHPSVGGLYGAITDLYASPGDPLFFLHHANMDRVWWSWQSKNLADRLYDISGPIEPHDWSNLKSRNVTLDDSIHYGTTVNVTTTIRDVMDIRNEFLCYEYDTLY